MVIFLAPRLNKSKSRFNGAGGFHGFHGWFSVRLGSEVGDLVCMFVEKAIRFAYQLGNRFPGLIKGIQALLLGFVEERITGMILRGEGVSEDRKLGFRDGCYENRIVGKGKRARGRRTEDGGQRTDDGDESQRSEGGGLPCGVLLVIGMKRLLMGQLVEVHEKYPVDRGHKKFEGGE